MKANRDIKNLIADIQEEIKKAELDLNKNEQYRDKVAVRQYIFWLKTAIEIAEIYL